MSMSFLYYPIYPFPCVILCACCCAKLFFISLSKLRVLFDVLFSSLLYPILRYATCCGVLGRVTDVFDSVFPAIVKVMGIVGGFAGFWDENQPPVTLTVKDVELKQHEGGSILG